MIRDRDTMLIRAYGCLVDRWQVGPEHASELIGRPGACYISKEYWVEDAHLITITNDEGGAYLGST